MPRFLSRYATPSITALFLISLISGVALFLHVGTGTFHAMHEWLSLALIVPFVLHLWKNWRPMTAYFRGAPMATALVLSAVAALPFAWPSAGREQAGGPPQFALAHEMMTHSPLEVAPALGTTPEDLVARLGASGFTVAGPDQVLTDVAAASGRTEADLARALLQAAS